MNLIKRLIPYKDLYYIFVWREFNVRYRNSILGVLWALLQPLSLMLLFTFIFTYVLKLNVGDYPRSVFFYSALLPWTFFASSINYSVNSLSSNRLLITRIYFPREIIPLAGISVAFIDMIIASLLFVLMMFYFKIQIGLAILWVIPLTFILLIFTISVSLIFASLNVYYRDVGLLSRFILQLLFFGSPVLYSIDNLSLKLKILLFLNPLTFIIENIRRCILEGRNIVFWQLIFALSLVLILYYFAHKLFTKIERDFADVI
ncbi:MAG: ABC transporter permease [Thermodesulfobacteriota bacterium]